MLPESAIPERTPPHPGRLVAKISSLVDTCSPLHVSTKLAIKKGGEPTSWADDRQAIRRTPVAFALCRPSVPGCADGV
jgi:hypothetical protein